MRGELRCQRHSPRLHQDRGPEGGSSLHPALISTFAEATVNTAKISYRFGSALKRRKNTIMSNQVNHNADAQKLMKEAKGFRLPNEWMPKGIKNLYFLGLALLSIRLFTHVIPGPWGYATSAVAVLAEGIALYSTHYFSRGSGAFRWALGLSGGCLLTFSIVHSTFSILDLNGAAAMYPELLERVDYYSHIVAFPLLAVLIGLSVIGICMTHPINRIRLKQAAEHTKIAIDRAEAASQLELMRSRAALQVAWLDYLREHNEREREYLKLLGEQIEIEEKKARMIAEISDPALQMRLKDELGLQTRQPFAAAGVNSGGEQNWHKTDGKWERRSRR
jgi:hypothetical protein